MHKKAFDIKNLCESRTRCLRTQGWEKPLKGRLAARLRTLDTAFQRIPLSLGNRQPNQCTTRNFDARWFSGSNPAEIGGR